MHYETRRFIKERLVTAQELAELLGVPLNTIQTRARRGKIEGVKKGQGRNGLWLFDRRDFDKGDRR